MIAASAIDRDHQVANLLAAILLDLYSLPDAPTTWHPEWPAPRRNLTWALKQHRVARAKWRAFARLVKET